MTVGIICEYNPFHNGHIYHINKIKKMYPDCTIIAVMSGAITQRGDISIINKWDKAEIALNHGIDLIVELPFNYAVQSADLFAKGAIEILNSLFVDVIIFGSESNNINNLKKLAKIQMSNKYNNLVLEYSKKLSYPEATGKALEELSNITVNSPNDILGLSYIKEIIKNKYNIDVKTIKRTNDYTSKKLEEIASATSIRYAIKNDIDIKDYVPIDTLNKIDKDLFLDKYFNYIKYKILSTDDLTYIFGIDDKISPRIKKGIIKADNIETLIKNIKTKKYPYNRIKRVLIYILIDFKKTDFKEENYIRVLGFNTKGKLYLQKVKKDIKLPVITNYSNSNGLADIDIKINNILTLNKDNQQEAMEKELKEVIRKLDIKSN